MVDRPAPHDLEVLGSQTTISGWIIECVDHAHTIDRVLFDSVDFLRWSDTENLIDRRYHIVAVVELRTRRCVSGNLGGPAHRHWIASATEVRGQQFGPLVGSTARPCPATVIHVVGQRAAERVQTTEAFQRLQVLVDGAGDAVLGEQFADGAVLPFG